MQYIFYKTYINLRYTNNKFYINIAGNYYLNSEHFGVSLFRKCLTFLFRYLVDFTSI